MPGLLGAGVACAGALPLNFGNPPTARGLLHLKNMHVTVLVAHTQFSPSHMAPDSDYITLL